MLPSTILYKVNFKYLIEHCLDKELWKQSWPIMEYDGLNINLKLKAINIIQDKIELMVRGHSKIDEIAFSFEIPMDVAHFNEKVFTLSLNSSVFNVIQDYEWCVICHSKSYEKARNLDFDSKEVFIQQIVRKLDEMGITDEEVRNAYIEAKTEWFATYKAREIVCSEMRYRLRKRHYLNYYSITGQQKLYDEFAKKYVKKTDMLKINTEMKEYSEYIENNDLLKEME